MQDPVYTWAIFGITWLVLGLREAYVRGVREGLRRASALAPPPAAAPSEPAPPPRRRPLVDGMSVEEAAEAADMTVEQFKRMISRN